MYCTEGLFYTDVSILVFNIQSYTTTKIYLKKKANLPRSTEPTVFVCSVHTGLLLGTVNCPCDIDSCQRQCPVDCIYMEILL
uniref:Uncharacterized protein n=1 Tax=Pararge aegeria TaxID=116150 RepID=S4P290_9NEOP